MNTSTLKAAKLLRLTMLIWAFLCKVLPKRKVVDPKNILVMVYGGVGDAIMMLPTLAALREKQPNAKITVLASTASGGQMIYRAFPQFYNHILIIPPTPASWKEAFTHNTMLMREQFDCVLISYISAYSLSHLLPAIISFPKQFLVFTDRHPLRKIYESLFKERLMLSWETDRRSEVLIHLEMLRGIDSTYAPVMPEWKWTLSLSNAASATATQWLRDNGLWNNQTNCALDFALIHASTSEAHSYRRYPLESFARVLEWLAAQNIAIVINGTPQEAKGYEELKRLSPVPMILCTTLDLFETGALMTHARLFVGNESGPAHISMLLNRPTVRIFGPSSYFGAAQWKSGAFEDVFLGIECSPCLRLGLLNDTGLNAHTCGHRNCLQQLPPEKVISAIEKVLTKEQVSSS